VDQHGRLVAMALIEARGLAKSFGATRAVDGLDFEVRPGVVTGFLGPNGAGKSTTMRLMLGLDHGEGRTLFDGKPFGELDQPMRHVGAVLESGAFHPTRTARNHLRMLATGSRIAPSRVDVVLGLVGLHDVADHRPRTFSLGMNQRLGLAAALLGDPHTLILDEPANGLDPQGIHWLRSLLRHLAAEGRSVFVSSHLLQEMESLADEVVVIGRGRLLAKGPMASFTRSAPGASVNLVTPDASLIVPRLTEAGATVEVNDDALVVRGLSAEQVGDLAHAAGARVHGLLAHHATLEEAFLAATDSAEEFRAVADGPGVGEGS
jgi:ABC-2 type transport system ATP-binding protein